MQSQMQNSRLGTPNTDAHASNTTLNRFPSVLLSRTNDTVVEVRGSAADPSEPSIEMSWAGGPRAPPPAYTPARPPVPTEPIPYGFVPTPGAPWRRVLLPPAGTPNARALFVLSLISDPWRAWMQTLTLHEGPDETQGKLVGILDIENGDIRTITMGELVKLTGSVLSTEQGYYGEQQYHWNFTTKFAHRLLWCLKDHRLTCLHWGTQTKPSLKTSTPVAQMGGGLRNDEITIWPAGHAPAILSHIVLSAVAIHQKRQRDEV